MHVNSDIIDESPIPALRTSSARRLTEDIGSVADKQVQNDIGKLDLIEILPDTPHSTAETLSASKQVYMHRRNNWTLAHTYYANMGGIRVMTGDKEN